VNDSDSTLTLIMQSPSTTPATGVQTCPAMPGQILSREGLWEHLQWAIELEHSTIPGYLCALYSIESGDNPEATEVVSSVLVEEMLHLTLAANLLNAVGGRPRLDIPQMLPGYPRPLPHGDRSFEISLLPFGSEAIETFLKIEYPSVTGGPPESEGYETIGQFYEAIKRGLLEVSAALGETNVFCGDPARQVTDKHVYSGGGRLIGINNLVTALGAIEEIVEQGEGANHIEVWDGDRDVFHPECDQVAHYYRFQQLKLGRRYRRGDTRRSGPTGDAILTDWDAVRPMRTNPRISDHVAGSATRLAQEEFNQAYCVLLQRLEKAFDGAPHLLEAAIGAMYNLRAQARALMEIPTGDGLTTAGPTFEYVTHDRRTTRP